MEQHPPDILDIRGLRVSKGFKQKELATAIGVSTNKLAKVERGLEPLEATLHKKIIEALKTEEIVEYRRRESGEGYVTSRPKEQFFNRRSKKLSLNKKHVIDLFCGVGGFSAGFDQIEEYEVVAGVDLLGDRLSTFSQNHPTANSYGQDIRTLKVSNLFDENPQPFVVVGGPPCQGFSSLRPFRNVEWADPRNNLGEEFVRVVAQLQPDWVVFENVVGLLTYQKGRVARSIQEALRAVGYRVEAKVLNAAYYGVPQRRERLIIVGSRKGKKFKWPMPTHFCDSRSMVGKSDLVIRPEVGLFSCNLTKAISVDNALQGLPEIDSGGKAFTYKNIENCSWYSNYIRNDAQVLTHHEATAHSEKMMEIIRHSGANIKALPAGLVTSGFSSCYSRLAGDEPSVTITVNFVHPASNRCIHPQQDRALTPREGARLQGFFDTFNFMGTRAQIVKQIGNAVPPILGKIIAKSILESD